jgi:hypothetical protein
MAKITAANFFIAQAPYFTKFTFWFLLALG